MEQILVVTTRRSSATKIPLVWGQLGAIPSEVRQSSRRSRAALNSECRMQTIALSYLVRLILGLLLLAATSFPLRAAATASSVQPTEVSNFALLDHQGRLHELRRSGGKAVVLFFTANGCPIARQSVGKLQALREKYSAQGVSVFLVNSSAGDDRESINKEAYELKAWHLPVLKDDTQGVARHLQARRTGEAIAISTTDWSIFYRGAIDDQMVEGAQKPTPTELYLENAIVDHLAGKPIRQARSVARGCLIHLDGGEGPDAAPVSYAKEIAPLLEAKCVQCHIKGNIGSWAMTGHTKVKAMASMIEEVVLTRRMPPWDADPQIGKFANDSALTVAQAQTLLRWVNQGALRGEGEDPLTTLAMKPVEDWPLGKPDIILRLPQAEQIPATGVLDYRHIEVRAGNTNTGWVAAAFVRPSNNKVVHHVIARVKEGGRKDHLGQGEMYVGWAPGATQGFYPKGAGKFLPEDARFDVELHYTPNGTPQTDQTEIGLYLLPETPTGRFESVPVVNTSFEIQPGDPNSAVSGMYGFKKDAMLYSLSPHMHLRGRWMKFEILFPNGKRETVCSIPRYDFNWQRTYVLEKPRKIPAGSWVVLTGGYDNSPQNPSNPDPKMTVHWGEQSFNEMFLGWYNVVWDIEPPKQASAK